jgi:hypothetical protein
VLSAVAGSDLYLHPAVGWMRLSFQTFTVGGTDGQTLFATTAAPGSRDAEALARIAELARAGVDAISIGALTHSTPAADVALDFLK